MRLLVTGGAGFIGANFLNLMVPRFPEHEFLNVDKLTYAGHPGSLAGIEGSPNYRFERLDIADPIRVAQAFGSFEPDVVVHFAAESHVDRSIIGPGEFVRTNVQGTFCLLEGARSTWASGDGLFLHVSTDEVYGSLGPTGRFREATRYDPSSPYSATKAASDHLVRSYHRTYGLPVRITNCSNNYGPYQFPEKLIPLMILNALEGKPLPVYGDGQNVRDWLFVEDHCEAIWAVMERGVDGETYNVGGDSERTNLDVVKQICAEVATHTGDSASRLEGLIEFVPDRPGHDRRYAIDASKIASSCDWRPRETFESGLARTVAWYLSNLVWVEQIRTGEYREWIKRNYEQRVGSSNP